MEMRIRLPELLEEHKPEPLTAYEVAKQSNGKILPATLYRLVKSQGAVKYIDADLLDALYDVLELKSLDELLTRQPYTPRSSAKPAAKAKRAR